MTSIETFAAHVAQCPVDTPTLSLLGQHTADSIAAWAAGTTTPEGRMLIALRAASGPRGIESDIALRTALARLSEIDDIHLPSMTTPGSIVVPAALTIAASLPNLDASALPSAILSGYEAITRLGLAIDGPSVLYRGIWPTYFAAPFGVAAVASRLLGLDAKQTSHALALSLTLASPGVGHHNAATTTRWLATGNAARNGWQAALAARAGFTADLAILDGPYFAGVYQITPKVGALTRDLGIRSMLSDISFKPWCGARQTMAAVQGLKEILGRGIAQDTITAISARVLPSHLKMIDHGVVAGDRASHMTSLPYQMALAALSPDAMFDIGQSPPTIPPAIRDLMNRVTLVADDSLTASYPAVWSAKVSVTASGQRHETTVRNVPGDPARAWTDTDVAAKFARYVAPLIGESDAKALFSACPAVLSGSSPPATILTSIDAIVARGIRATG